MDKMAEIFIDEANDLLDKLENLILELENNPEDIETIQEIFRIMHTIKGSSGMFGFDTISSFTHEVESAFNAVRNKEVKVTQELITHTLSARDYIRKLLAEPDNPSIKNESQDLIEIFKLYVKQNSINSKQKESEQKPLEHSKHIDEKNLTEATWRIHFIPASDIFKNGTKPCKLIEELQSMGKCSITPFFSKIPRLNDIEPTVCYISWEIIITTTAMEDDLKDVFIFLDSTSTIQITKISDDDDDQSEPPKKIGEILVERNLTTKDVINEVLSTHKTIGQVLTDSKVVSKEIMQAALAEQKHLRDLQEKKQQETSNQTIKVNSEKLDKLIDLVGELVTFNARLTQISQFIQTSELYTIAEQGERLILELRDTTMDMRMLPIGTIFSRFKRLVRDLSKELNKDIELITEGAETELDKTVIEKLNDPLVHLIRNSIDHGIETPAVREASGKNPQGKVTLKAEHNGAFVLITIEDDGAGLNTKAIHQKAIERGLINTNDELTDNEICDLILQPGFSTASQVTSVSGRGVGMDVVKKDVTALGGTISIVTRHKKGTKFILKLPLTLAIIEGILVKIGNGFFVIPLSNVIECLEFQRTQSTKICSSINIRNEIIPYIDLRTFFEIDDPLPTMEQIIIVNDQDSRMGLVIDKVIGNYQTVIKPLGRLYKNTYGFSGATILGNGSVALILDIYKLSHIVKNLEEANISTLISKQA
ncbi:MAG: chemotaxis protein CheA [Treponema sp.]|nr:chemotaxis protein CheA [Treponema sp.]